MNRLFAARELGTIALLGLICVGAGLREPRFLQASSLEGILLWTPLLAIVGLGEMMVIVTRGIDVSVGSMLGLSGMIVGMTFRAHPHMSVFVGAFEGLGVGILLGAVNGSLIALANVPPIIATLGTLSAYRGLVFIVSHGTQINSNDIPDSLTSWSLNGPLTIAGVTASWLFVIAMVACIKADWLVKLTRFGRDVFSIGSNPEAARLRGVPVRRTTFLVYTISGMMSGLAGVLYASRYGFVNPGSAGQGFELTVIAAVAIGGVRITGGYGSVWGVLLGCFVLGSVNVALAVLGIEGSWQTLVYGAIILLALVFDTILKRVWDRAELRPKKVRVTA